MNNNSQKVATIVVTYNRLPLLKECIVSLRNQTYKNHQIIVINNGSTDDTLNWLKQQHDIYTITQENSGGAGGFYTGIKWACENGYDYSWVMDDDVITNNTALQSLLSKTLHSDGFICSRVLDINNELCNVPLISKKKSQITGELLWGNKLNHNMLEVDIASFVSILIPTNIVYQVGLPHKSYFIWGDDTEYTQRISQLYHSYMDIDSIVVHKRASLGILSIFTEKNKRRINNYFYSYRNRINNQLNFKGKIRMTLSACYDIIRLILKFDMYKAYIIVKALVAAVFFHPTIEFPSK